PRDHGAAAGRGVPRRPIRWAHGHARAAFARQPARADAVQPGVPPRRRGCPVDGVTVADVAAAVVDWAALADLAGRCTACPELVANRTTVVVGEHRPGARLLLVGEAPGADEDARGLPFVGRAGQLLDLLLVEAGLSRDDVSVANVLKCRPPGNRAPSRVEVTNCRGWLDRQVVLADARVVVTLGGTAAAWAFGRSVRLADVRGRAHELP